MRGIRDPASNSDGGMEKPSWPETQETQTPAARMPLASADRQPMISGARAQDEWSRERHQIMDMYATTIDGNERNGELICK